MLLSNFLRKKRSKHGFTLVEVLAAVFVLVIVFTGVLTAIIVSQQMVFTNNVKDEASDTLQLISDQIMTVATGYTYTTDVKNEVASIIDAEWDTDSDATGYVNAQNMTATGFMEPSSTVSECQYVIGDEIVSTDADTEIATSAGTTYSAKSVSEEGLPITIRVYYKKINDSSDYAYVESSIFVPKNYVSY